MTDYKYIVSLIGDDDEKEEDAAPDEETGGSGDDTEADMEEDFEKDAVDEL